METLLQFLSQLLHLGLSAFFVYVAILFLRSDPRAHTWCLLIGTVILALLGIAQFLLFSPPFDLVGKIFGDGTNGFSAQQYFQVTSAISVVARALTLYGLLVIALIQYRQSRAPKFEDAND